MVSADELQATITQLRQDLEDAKAEGDAAAVARIRESLTVNVAAYAVKTGRAPD